VRSAGVSSYVDVGMRELVKKGALVGPDVLAERRHPNEPRAIVPIAEQVVGDTLDDALIRQARAAQDVHADELCADRVGDCERRAAPQF